MTNSKFSPQKKTQKPIAKKQSASIPKPKREDALCGASVKIGKLVEHESKCSQCKLEREYKNSKAA